MTTHTRGHRPTLSLDVAAPRTNASTGAVAGPESAVLPGRSAGAALHTHRPLQPPSPSTISAADASQPFALQSIFAHLADVRALQGALVKEHIALESAETSTWPGAHGTDGRDDGRKATAQAYEALRVDFAKRQDGVERVIGRLDELAEAIRSFDQVPEQVPAHRPTLRTRSNSEPLSPEGVARSGTVPSTPR